MRKLWNWIRRDGLLHIETSLLLCMVFDWFMPLWLAAVLAIACGIGWELVGKKFGGVANWHDVICDCIGVVGGVLLILLRSLLAS